MRSWTGRSTPGRSKEGDEAAHRSGRMPRAGSQPDSWLNTGPDARWLSTPYYDEARGAFNSYDPTLWLPTLSFKLSEFIWGPWFCISAGVTLATIYFMLYAPESQKSWVDMPLDAHIVMGGALSFLVVMRTDTSMERWWEARCSWQIISGCCLSIGAQTAPVLRDEAATERLLMQLMAFAVSLKAHLRDEKVSRKEVGERMDWQFVRLLNKSCCPPLQALKAISETVRTNLPVDDGSKEGADNTKLGSAIYDELSEQIRVLNHAVGACRKIKSTPMTFGCAPPPPPPPPAPPPMPMRPCSYVSSCVPRLARAGRRDNPALLPHPLARHPADVDDRRVWLARAARPLVHSLPLSQRRADGGRDRAALRRRSQRLAAGGMRRTAPRPHQSSDRPSPLPTAPRPTPNAQRTTPNAQRPTPTACLAAAACPSQEYILELEETLLEMLPGYEPPPTDDEDEGEADQPPQPYPHQMVALPPPNALPAGAQRAQQQAAANAMAAAGGTPGQGYGYPPGYYALPPNYHPGYPPPPQQQQMDQYALDQAWVGQQAWNNISPTWKQARTRPRPDERGGAPSNGQRSASAQRKR